MKALHAIALTLALGLSGAVLAYNTVKSGGREDKPDRAVDDNTVKSGGREDKPGCAADCDVKARGASDKPGRTATN